MKNRSINDPRLTEGRRAALYALRHQRTESNQDEMMKRLKRLLRCPIPLNGMDCQFPNCGCDLAPDEPEATAELQKIASASNVRITHCPPAKAPGSKRMTARSKVPCSSARSLGAMRTPNVNPNAFVWTKMEDEGGQSIKQILNRKELERQASDGTFWWGIGESKIEKVRSLVANERNPAVLFSKMLSRAHSRDSDPDEVLLWEVYQSANGEEPLPRHIIVTSRAARDRDGNLKRHHYALVCASSTALALTGGGTLNTGALQNTGTRNPIGSSQVTSVVEQKNFTSEGKVYEIKMRATLSDPYCVKLITPEDLEPRELTAQERQLLKDVSLDGKTIEDWKALTKQLRRICHSKTQLVLSLGRSRGAAVSCLSARRSVPSCLVLRI
jgi:hypothetical protein